MTFGEREKRLKVKTKIKLEYSTTKPFEIIIFLLLYEIPMCGSHTPVLY